MINDNYVITKQGCVIEKNKFSDNDINWIKSDLTVHPYSNFMKKESFRVYLEDDNHLCMPKHYALEKFSIPCIVDNNYGDNINATFIIELREEQKKIIDSILYAYQNNGGGILSLPCGFGKTIIALYFITLLQKKTFIIVHREFLIKHWHDKIKETMKNVTVKIIRGTNVNDEIPKCDIAICMLQTLSLKDFPKEYFDTFGHIIIDECHHVSTTLFSTIFFKINSNYMLGLSATPERKDNMTKVIKWHIGNIINVNSVKHIINIDVKRYVLNFNKDKILKNNEAKFSNKITKLLDDNFRNDIIKKLIMHEMNKSSERQFLVLSDRVEHLKILKNLLNNDNIHSVGLFVGGMTSNELEKSKKCKIMLGTYSMANEGLDIPTLNCLVLTSPRKEILQTIGRISRLKDKCNTIQPLIIDLIDIENVFVNESEKRLVLYKKNNYNIIDYIYNESKNTFEKNKSNNRNYSIYLLGEKINENKFVSKSDLLIESLYEEMTAKL